MKTHHQQNFILRAIPIENRNRYRMDLVKILLFPQDFFIQGETPRIYIHHYLLRHRFTRFLEAFNRLLFLPSTPTPKIKL